MEAAEDRLDGLHAHGHHPLLQIARVALHGRYRLGQVRKLATLNLDTICASMDWVITISPTRFTSLSTLSVCTRMLAASPRRRRRLRFEGPGDLVRRDDLVLDQDLAHSPLFS